MKKKSMICFIEAKESRSGQQIASRYRKSDAKTSLSTRPGGFLPSAPLLPTFPLYSAASFKAKFSVLSLDHWNTVTAHVDMPDTLLDVKPRACIHCSRAKAKCVWLSDDDDICQRLVLWQV